MKPTRLHYCLIALICCSTAPLAVAGGEAEPNRILFLGDSLTAGYGISPEEAYPALIQRQIEAAGLPYEAVALGLSGETTAGGLRRASWVMQKPFDILVLALGSNDGLRGIDPSDTRANLQGIIDIARTENPEVEIVLAGMQMPPNLGEAYTTEFRELFPDLAEANDATLIPFLLKDVGGHAELNIADGIHPNPEGHEIVARNVWDVLEPLLVDNES